MMWWWDGNHMGTGGWIGVGFMILFWIAVVIGIIFLVRYVAARPSSERPQQGSPTEWQSPGPQSPGPQSPGEPKSEAIRILEERYARGDIDRDEFHRRKADLSS